MSWNEVTGMALASRRSTAPTTKTAKPHYGPELLSDSVCCTVFLEGFDGSDYLSLFVDGIVLLSITVLLPSTQRLKRVEHSICGSVLFLERYRV